MKIHFLLLALVAFVALSQHYVDARLHDQAIRRMTEHRLLDELLQRRMEELEEMEGEQGSFQDEFVESRRLRYVNSGFCCSLVKMEPNPLLCGHCSYGHRWSPSCGSTRRCKYRCKSHAERRRCKGSQCYKYADC